MHGGAKTLDLQAIGLVYDGAGVAILGMYSLYKMITGMRQSLGLDSLGKHMADVRVDTIVGSLLLLLGFSFQFAGRMGCDFGPIIHLWMLIALGILCSVYWFFGLRRRLSNLLLRAAESNQAS